MHFISNGKIEFKPSPELRGSEAGSGGEDIQRRCRQRLETNKQPHHLESNIPATAPRARAGTRATHAHTHTHSGAIMATISCSIPWNSISVCSGNGRVPTLFTFSPHFLFFPFSLHRWSQLCYQELGVYKPRSFCFLAVAYALATHISQTASVLLNSGALMAAHSCTHNCSITCSSVKLHPVSLMSRTECLSNQRVEDSRGLVL